MGCNGGGEVDPAGYRRRPRTGGEGESRSECRLLHGLAGCGAACMRVTVGGQQAEDQAAREIKIA